MKFDGRADVRGFLKKFSTSLTRSSKKSVEARENEDEEVDAMAQSFIGNEELRHFDPGRGTANVEVLGHSNDGALDIGFTWDEGKVPPKHGHHRSQDHEKETIRGRRPSVEMVMDGQPSQGGAAEAAEPDVPLDRPPVPLLNILMLVCGTRGDVQPFVALGLKLKDYGHRVRIATHQDYRKFVTEYGLEFYPLGGDPKILSDFIVKHRGVFTVNTKDAFENIEQVEDIVFSSYDACTLPDPEDASTRPFTAEAIIANPPSYGHIHCAEKLKIPLHIYFTMPWTPTRNFPHPLSRMKNVRDTRPSSIAIRNYLSYIMVNEYTYTGLSNVFNRFRKEKLGLPPVRLGNSGATLLDFHNVPFSYCWSPSLVPKPDDWDKHINVTGYFFLNEGQRTSYKPPPELERFLETGPAPVYLGFGSLMVDDREKVTQKILDAFKETGQRLLLSKGWADLGEGFDIPDTVMLLDDVPHDWLLPQCSAVVHHGGAGTTAAGLLAACPTTVIPFFGDQAFWGSAVFRRGVGPKPIPIDRLTTKRLVEALTFMQKPEVKDEACKVAALIKQEDGVAVGMEDFHRNLPLKKLQKGQPVEWPLSKPSMANFFHELGGGIGDLFMDPVRGAKEEGIIGAVKGMGLGVQHVVTRPIKGVGLAGYSVWEYLRPSSEGGPTYPKCFMPSTKGVGESSRRNSSDSLVSEDASVSMATPSTSTTSRPSEDKVGKSMPGMFNKPPKAETGRKTEQPAEEPAPEAVSKSTQVDQDDPSAESSNARARDELKSRKFSRKFSFRLDEDMEDSGDAAEPHQAPLQA